ncbi:MAG: hypothetical protein ABSF63_06440 [Candidatus Bathyarchaeia archaeon]
MVSRTGLCMAMSWSIGTAFIVLNYQGIPSLGTTLSDITLLLIAMPAAWSTVQVILKRAEPQSAIVWIILLSISLRLILPLSEGGNAFMINADQKYSFQIADIIAYQGTANPGLQTNRAYQYILFPALQILTVQISAVSGLQLYDVARFFPILLTIIIIPIVFKAYSWTVSPRAAVPACFLFAVCYKYNWFDGMYIPESLGILFFVMAFYAVLRGSQVRGRSTFVIFFTSVSLIVMTHLFSSLMLSVALCLCYVIFKLMARIRIYPFKFRMANVLVALVPFAAWLSLVAISPVIVTAGYAAEYTQSLLRLLTNGVSPGTGTVSLVATGGVPISIQTLLVLVLGFVLFSGGAGALGLIYAIRAKGAELLDSRGAMARVIVFFVIAVMFGILSIAGILSSSAIIDLPSRLIPFVYFFWAPVFGFGTIFVAKKITELKFTVHWSAPRKTTLACVLLAALLILPAFSTWLLLPAENYGRVTFDDGNMNSLSTWVRTHSDKRVILIGDPILAETVGAMGWQPIDETLLLPPDPGPLYYGRNMTDQLLTQLNYPYYIIVNQAYLSHRYYLITYTYESKPPTKNQISTSFDDLNSSPKLDRISSSGVPTLYLATYPG